MNGAQHQRKRFTVANTSDNAPPNAELRQVCAQAGHVPSGPMHRRVCFRCGDPLRPPSLEEVSRMMADIKPQHDLDAAQAGRASPETLHALFKV